MMILNIFLGILGLGLVVLVHETGHFIAARLSGIEVEAFSIGMGKKLVSYKRNNTEYRISLLPFGGYCKLKGEEQFVKAMQDKEDQVPFEKGSIFSVSAGKKIITYLAGPLFNLVFAVLVLWIIWFAGFKYQSWDNKIILLSDFSGIPGFERDNISPADSAGLKTGDVISGINGKEIISYRDIQEAVAPSGGDKLTLTIERNNVKIDLEVTPEIDKESGTGKIGISAWIDPVIGEITKDSAAYIAGLQADNIIIGVNGTKIENHLDIYSILYEKPSKLDIEYQRDGVKNSTVLICEYNEAGEAETGLAFKPERFSSPKMGIVTAFVKGAGETFETFALTLKSLGLLFTGVKLNSVLAGPIRITYYIGQVASNSFTDGLGSGLSTIFRFLSLLSVALAFGNLLPIPALDGGRTLLSIYELIKRKPVSPRIFYRYQMIGLVFVLALIVFMTFSDIFFLAGR